MVGSPGDARCDVSGGRATAGAIPGAELVIIDGMGHSLPRPLWPEIATHIAELVRGAEAMGRLDAAGSQPRPGNGPGHYCPGTPNL